jgi:hypothetical protein
MRQKFHLLYVFYCRPLSIDVADEKLYFVLYV